MLLYVVIKGSCKEAIEFAVEGRGFSLAVGSKSEDTVCGLIDMSVDEANAWLCEQPSKPPYPVGALLWWFPCSQ